MALREAISYKFKEDNDLDYSPAQIVVSNGAIQSIANACLALLNPGDEAVILTPYWVSYIEIVKFAGAHPVMVSPGIDQPFQVTPAQLAEALSDRSRILIFSSPSNPPGRVYSRAAHNG